MKQFLFCLLLLTAQLLSAQSRVTVGLIGGIGQTVACKDCMYASTHAVPVSVWPEPVGPE
jgi:hypothetical protein